MKKLIGMLVLGVLASVSMADLLSYSSFNDAVSTNGIPAGWTAVAGTGGHSSIKAGSLSYAGYPSADNSWGLGQGTEDYRNTFSGATGLSSGDKVYYSFLLRLNSPLDAFNTGNFRLYNSAAVSGSGVVVGWGTTDYTQNKMGFSLSNRNRNYSNTVGADLQKTAETYTAADTTYLIVAAYNRGATYQTSTVELWINPESSSFGAATPPTATITMPSYQNGTGYINEANWDRLEYVSAGSGSAVASWQVDEIRIGTDWASTVVPEPATVGMLGLGALITLLIRRFRS